jgi:hypothetical protein
MPYIVPERRGIFAELKVVPETPGELTYLLTVIALAYIESHGADYTTFNEVIGSLECTKLELYRQAVAPYEDSKIRLNGNLRWP